MLRVGDASVETDFTREELVACVEREIGMRERVYPDWVRFGRMTAPKADRELAMMRAVRAVVLALPAIPPPQANLFGDAAPAKGARR